MHINTDNILLGIVNYYFLQNFHGVTALDLRQNFLSAQYLENELTESDQILYAHQHEQDLTWDCYLLFFSKF